MTYLLLTGVMLATVVLPCAIVYGILPQNDGRVI